ncbi:MAG: secondary thiamine-phosphate synthase enzyme YjbQ [Clostridium sp.]|nr:secondary thiamine-phosphate synthase enzyme YjbQ [Clostridium sp.]
MKRTELICETLDRDSFTDITDPVNRWLSRDKADGLVHLFLPHTTAALVISDRMDTVTKDTRMIFARLFPQKDAYVHAWPNSDAHIKSTLCGCQVTIPVAQGRMLLGKWQRVYVAEGDGPKLHRKVICTFFQ